MSHPHPSSISPAFFFRRVSSLTHPIFPICHTPFFLHTACIFSEELRFDHSPTFFPIRHTCNFPNISPALVLVGAALATGLAVTNTAAFGAITALVCASGLAGMRAIGAIDEPLKLFRSDAAALLPFGGGAIEGAPESGGANGGGGDTISSFYRSSTLLGLVVGASFLVSPVSPIGLFESEAPVTHFFRQVPFSHTNPFHICHTPLCPVYHRHIFTRSFLSSTLSSDMSHPILPTYIREMFLFYFF